MEWLSNFLEEVTKDKITEAEETVQKAGWLMEKVILPFSNFVSNNLWMIPVLLICAAVCTTIIKRRK